MRHFINFFQIVCIKDTTTMTDPLNISPSQPGKRMRLVKAQDVSRSCLSVEDLHTLSRVKQKQREKHNAMLKAMQAVNKGGISQRQAASMFSIPRSTLQEKMHSKPLSFKEFVDVTRPPLSYEEERELFRWIHNMVNSGFDVPHQCLEFSAKAKLMEKANPTFGDKEAFKNSWMEKFLKKWTRVGYIFLLILCKS